VYPCSDNNNDPHPGNRLFQILWIYIYQELPVAPDLHRFHPEEIEGFSPISIDPPLPRKEYLLFPGEFDQFSLHWFEQR
jgi:hypothetical protein